MVRPPALISLELTRRIDEATDLRLIRADILRFLAGQAAGPDLARTGSLMEIVATELAGNALRHGTPPAVVRLLSDDDCFVIDISDGAVHDGPTLPPNPPGLHAGGRGLAICLATADRVGWYTTGTTKHVWASFNRPGGGRPPS